HSLLNAGSGKWSAATAVLYRLGSSARRVPSRGSGDTDLLGLRAIDQLRPATCDKSPHHYGFWVGGQQNLHFSTHTSNPPGSARLNIGHFRRAMDVAPPRGWLRPRQNPHAPSVQFITPRQIAFVPPRFFG